MTVHNLSYVAFLAICLACAGDANGKQSSYASRRLSPSVFLGLHLGSDTADALDRELGRSIALTGVHPLSRRLWVVSSDGYQLVETDGAQYSPIHHDEVVVDSIFWSQDHSDLLSDNLGIEKWKKYNLDSRRKPPHLRYLGVGLGMPRAIVIDRLRPYRQAWQDPNTLLIRSTAPTGHRHRQLYVTAAFKFRAGELVSVALDSTSVNNAKPQ